MKIVVDSDEIAKLCDSAGNAVMDEDGEKALATLMSIYTQIGDFINEVKTNIKKNALDIDRNFTGYSGDYVKIELRKFGSAYAIERPEVVPPEFVKTRTVTSLDSKRIDEYVKDNGELPMGIERLEREPQIVIKIKEN